jgi:hypothetical protein
MNVNSRLERGFCKVLSSGTGELRTAVNPFDSSEFYLILVDGRVQYNTPTLVEYNCTTRSTDYGVLLCYNYYYYYYSVFATTGITTFFGRVSPEGRFDQSVLY